jgi:hypothetical protein
VQTGVIACTAFDEGIMTTIVLALALACGDMMAFKSASASVSITKAERVSDNVSARCRVDGVIDERTGAGGKTYGIGFAISLPDNWNGRFLFQGGGGLNGSVGVGPRVERYGKNR